MANKYLIILLLLLSGCGGKRMVIQDIYYYPEGIYNQEFFKNSQIQPYTLNVCAESCITTYIERQYYDTYAKQYIDLGLKYPFPKKEGEEGLLYPAHY
jgi:hypothetical protein